MNISSELKRLYEEDQQDRAGKYDEINLEKMRANDSVRLRRAYEIYGLIKTGQVGLSPEDYFHLAMLFQHSPKLEDYQTALEVSIAGAERGSVECAWLSAAAEDRYLLAKGERQKWGTQFKKNAQGEWEQMPMFSDEESKITDEMREEKNVPPRADQMKVFLNRKDIK